MKRGQPNSGQKQTRDMYAISLGVLGGLLGLLVLMASFSPKPKEVPVELLGIWTTKDAGHSDRFFEVSPVTVSFGTGNGTVSTGFIQKFEVAFEGRETVYAITYKGDDGESKLWLNYDPASGVLRFRNQQSIAWVKSRES